MIILSIILSCICLVIIVLIFAKINKTNNDNGLLDIQNLIQTEIKNIRSDSNEGFRGNREEINKTIATFQLSFMDSLQRTADLQTQAFEKLIEKVEVKLQQIKESQDVSSKENRDELRKSLKEFQDVFSQNVKDFNELQRQKFEEMSRKQDELVKSTELKLERMRETVDEKLHKTLEERLGQSFKMVSEQLLAVQKGLGEMQTLALGVGDLKKVLSNVKTRGVLGEIQLGNILEQIMAPEQYQANVKTKPGSNDLVEYAIKLPGKDDFGKEVYLPIDAKFPQDDYVRLQEAYDTGDSVGIDSATKSLNASIKKFAKDISEKYIAPPHTTDFGIMFLPIEGLFAEIVRQPELIATLQREFKIIVTGPTTLAAILNSLQMGFKTLAIQKRSSEVWQILSSVKKEFGTFGDVLVKAQKKIQEASSEIDTLVTTRTNKINVQLRNVQEMPGELKSNQDVYKELE